MKKVLLVGNGFDLAHGLMTKYEDFLYLMKNWEEFYSEYEKKRKEEKSDRKLCSKNEMFGMVDLFECFEEPYKRYTENASEMDKDNIDKLGCIIKNNSWVKYYCQCEAEIDGWIDFEREIYPIIELMEFVFDVNYEMIGDGGEFGDAHIKKEAFSPRLLRIAKLWEEYFDTTGDNFVCVKKPFASMKYGILKKKIVDRLKKEFDEFVQAFEIYLYEFVYKNVNVKPLKQIKEIGINKVISFNYTLIEEVYGIECNDVHHIHGMIRKESKFSENNMVMGINEHETNNMEFIYFVKYFQRIQKASGVKYKSFVDSFSVDSLGQEVKEKYELYIYGHSLDETDEDILKYVIGKRTMEDTLDLKPEKVIIYYYNSTDYEQKVINLFKLYGRSIVEEYLEKGLFKFIQTSGEVWRSTE